LGVARLGERGIGISDKSYNNIIGVLIRDRFFDWDKNIEIIIKSREVNDFEIIIRKPDIILYLEELVSLK
jgi:hypothetical protein